MKSPKKSINRLRKSDEHAYTSVPKAKSTSLQSIMQDKNVYVDGSVEQRDLENQLRFDLIKMGARIVQFFDSSVDYLISSHPIAARICQFQKDHPGETNMEEYFRSRAETSELANLSSHASGISSGKKSSKGAAGVKSLPGFLAQAVKLNIKVRFLPEVAEYIRERRVQLGLGSKTDAPSTHKRKLSPTEERHRIGPKSKPPGWRMLKAPFVKIEDSSSQCRPFFSELPAVPMIHIVPGFSGSPFDPAQLEGLSDYFKIEDADDVNQQTPVGSNIKHASKLVESAKVNLRKKVGSKPVYLKKKKSEPPSWCDLCKCEVDVMNDKHKDKWNDADSWRDVDQAISRAPLDTFLNDINLTEAEFDKKYPHSSSPSKPEIVKMKAASPKFCHQPALDSQQSVVFAQKSRTPQTPNCKGNPITPNQIGISPYKSPVKSIGPSEIMEVVNSVDLVDQNKVTSPRSSRYDLRVMSPRPSMSNQGTSSMPASDASFSGYSPDRETNELPSTIAYVEQKIDW